jgi:hypothetical protein
MASGDLKGKMNYRDWPVSRIAMSKTTDRASHGFAWKWRADTLAPARRRNGVRSQLNFRPETSIPSS